MYALVKNKNERQPYTDCHVIYVKTPRARMHYTYVSHLLPRNVPINSSFFFFFFLLLSFFYYNPLQINLLSGILCFPKQHSNCFFTVRKKNRNTEQKWRLFLPSLPSPSVHILHYLWTFIRINSLKPIGRLSYNLNIRKKTLVCRVSVSYKKKSTYIVVLNATGPTVWNRL